MVSSTSSSSGLSRWVYLIPECFLWLALAGGLLADIAAWAGPFRRLVLAALLIVVWAGVQGLVIDLALAVTGKNRPVTLSDVLLPLARTVLSVLLFLPGAVYAASCPGPVGELAFAAVGGAMLVQLPSLALLRRRVKREEVRPA